MGKKKGCFSMLRKALQTGVAATLSVSTLGGGAARAASYTWDGNFPGGSGNAKWSNANNWGVPDGANVAPPTGTAGLTSSDVFFSGALKTAPQMDNAYSIRTLTFDGGASSFTLGSQRNPPNAETLSIGTGGIINNSANLQTINSPLALGAAQTWNASSGGLQVGGTLALGANNLTVGGDFTTALGGSIGGSGGLVKTGNGVLSLTASNSFSGGTAVGQGTLAVNNALGSATGTGAVTVSPGAILTGAGIVNGAVAVNGTLSPGDSVGVMRINNDLTMGAASAILMEVGGTGAGEYDRLIVAGKLTLDGVITVVFVNGYTPMLGDSLNLFDYGLIDATNFDPDSDLFLPNLPNGWGWDKTSFSINVQILAIPEPASVTLLGISLLTLGRYSVRRKS